MSKLCGRPPKLTPAQVEEARLLRARGEKWADIARFFGVAQSTLQRHLAGEVKNHRGPADSASVTPSTVNANATQEE